MKQLFLHGFLIGIILSCSSQQQFNSLSENALISQLDEAENSKDLHLIESLLMDDVVMYTPDLLPISGKEGVISIYQYIFSEGNNEWIKYMIDTTYLEEEKIVECGKNITKKMAQSPDTNVFKVEFIRVDDNYKISTITFGQEASIKREIPELIKPTGTYQVGRAAYFYGHSKSSNQRLLAFEIWYPAKINQRERAPFQSEAVVNASAEFLGFHLFAINYFSLIESNAYASVPAYPGRKFPVLLYNHGYGGFTSVYQTVFEELASHGYMVVSIAHENESALFIKGDGNVITNSPDNEFYSSRATELNGPKIGTWQSVILNDDEEKENLKAYQKLIELSPLHNQSTRFWRSDTKAIYELLVKLNQTDALLGGTIDLEMVGVFGHSVGGATAGQLGFEDDWVKAGINLDGFQFGDLINNKLQIPFMFVSSNPEGNRYLRVNTFMGSSEADCYHSVIKGFSHSSFTDLEYLLSGNYQMIELQRELIKTFFDKYLKHNSQDLKNLVHKFENLTIQSN